MPRLFVAVELPADLRQRLQLMGGGIPGARWLPEDALHLTLTFVGEVSPAVARDTHGALARAAAAPFPLLLTGVGTFPLRGEPKVVWAGVAPSPELTALKSGVDRALTAASVPFERRKFYPHVTLARLRGAPLPRVTAFLTHHALFRSEPFTVNRFCLMSSVLAPRGAKYRVEGVYPLAAR